MKKHTLFTVAALFLCVLLLSTLYLVFFYAPTESTMGIVQKIFYFHVPSAYTMYLGWTICTLASIAYLATRKERWDMLACSSAELALIFSIAVMITGPLWGRKSWGAYWTWDPRLTTSLLLTLIIVSYVLLRSLSTGQSERKFASALAILGACVIPIIHISVNKWRGQHPTVIGSQGGGLAPEMKLPFIMGMLSFTVLFAVLLWRRYELEKNRRTLAHLQEESAANGFLEEEEE